jgi:hypothetical protein
MTMPEESAILNKLVQDGNVAAVRRYLDSSLAGEKITRPVWEHVRTATIAGNGDMMRLLVTWGAAPTVAQLLAFASSRGDQFAEDLQRLRLAGLNVPELPDLPAPAKTASSQAQQESNPDPVDQIPDEWKAVLKGFQTAGKSPEALLAGGALRDLFNGRAVKDVDIFMRRPAFGMSEQKVISRAFAAAGVKLENSEFSMKEYPERFRSGKIKNVFGETTAWTLVSQDSKTEYNVIFMTSGFADIMRKSAARGYANREDILMLSLFDVGLCQIGFDGEEIVRTKAYVVDAANKTLTLLRPKDTTVDHLERLTEKYKDFEPDAALRDFLQSARAPKKKYGLRGKKLYDMSLYGTKPSAPRPRKTLYGRPVKSLYGSRRRAMY